ncbi:uncharacterized protein LOC110028665 [Phalaenopsis equestris]|uniref:uncharacterized protein LOC110028665 n=1 Tax=Phalaenopsis equestris TaxID=78828 RepID=UPI0009E47CE2|nr:uncharacterized protein LOC110028665 [Phalaenopsis equestris]
MGFLTSNRSSQPVDKALSRIKTSLKKCNPSNGPDKNLLFLPSRKTSAAYFESEIEDIDIDMQLKIAEGMYDESNYMWLSSDCDSLPRTKTSALFSEPATELIDIDMQLKLTEGMSDESNCMWLSSDCDSLLSSDLSGDIYQLNSWNHSFIDGLPLMKAENPDSTVHDLQINLSGEHLKEEGVLSDQSISFHGSSDFSYDRFQKGSSIYESSSASLSTMDDFDRTGSWITPFDLNLESSELIQLKDGVNSICSDFSSPINSYRRNPQSESSFSSPNSVTTIHMTEASSSLSSEYEQDEPLFWPYSQNLYESSELGKSFLCISPRKEKNTARDKVVNELKSVEGKLKKTDSLSANKKSSQLQCGRRPELSQKPKKSATCKNYNNSQRPPLHSSTYLAQASAKSFPCNTLTKKRIKTTMKETTQLKSKNQRSKVEELPAKSLLELEATFFYEVFMEDATIEKLVGLNEFDSHEWENFKLREDCIIEAMKKEERSQLGRETFFLQLFGKTL